MPPLEFNKVLSKQGGSGEHDGRFCEMEAPRPFCLIVFGASGDLTKRKIIPAVFQLKKNGLLPKEFFVLGVARTDLGDQGFRQSMQEHISLSAPEGVREDLWKDFQQILHYERVDYSDASSYSAFLKKLAPLEEKFGTRGNRIFYFAIPPSAYETVAGNLGVSGAAREKEGASTHVVVEKPFGRDLASARGLNAALKAVFREDQIYRMDHYLAKETVQNILMFRFANSIFEPLWNRKYIDHVQITVSETLGVEHRAGYYEQAGVLRDMFQNHIFQLLALTAMEPPSLFEADRVRDEKVKVFGSIRPFPLESLQDHVVLGQYGPGRVKAGPINEKDVCAYTGEPGVAEGSTTPTYAALKVYIDNWRWNGVPFYLRSGKRLNKRKAEISVHYKAVPHLMFNRALQGKIEPSTLVLRVQPEEGISLSFQAKRPGSRVCLMPVDMDFSYGDDFLSLGGYERVLLDCMQGDRMLFVREDGVDISWALLTPVIERLEAEAARTGGLPKKYAAGSDGPKEAATLLEADGRAWRPL